MNKFYLIALLFAAACGGPSGGTVPNNPPVIEQPADAFSIKLGSLSPDVMSGLLWPADWTEDQYETNVRTIDEDGKKLMALIIEKEKKPTLQINALWRQFRGAQCIEQFSTASTDPTTFSETDAVSFKDGSPAVCVQNQAQRQALHGMINQALQAEGDPANPGPITKLQIEIATTLGKGKDLFSGVDTSASGMKFSLDASGNLATKIFFGNFQNTGKAVSTATKNKAQLITNVVVSPSGNALSFVVPDLVTPGIHYQIALVRVAPLFTFSEFEDDGSSVATEEAVYKGDVTVVNDDGTVLGAGSAQIVGKFTGSAN